MRWRRRSACSCATERRPEAAMLKGNLSTRPFYNENLVTLGLVLVGLVAAALTYFNYRQIETLSAEKASYQTKIDANQQQAARITAEANTVRQAVNPQE